MKQKVIFNLIAVFILTAITLSAQTYHDECKEDLRAFLRQGTNYEKLGLTTSDTLNWDSTDAWISKISDLIWIVDTSVGILRIDTIEWHNLDLEGSMLFRSPLITSLDCSFNDISSLDVSNNINLKDLVCYYNPLSTLDVSNNIALEMLICYGNTLNILDVSNNPNLNDLMCNYNQLSVLDVSNNLLLEWLGCNSNNLSELDLTNNVALTELFCQRNNLTTLTLNDSAKITRLNCSVNRLKFSTLPTIFDIDYIHYDYTAQAKINGGIISSTDTIDLSVEYNINGNITTFEWFDITGDYYINDTIVQPINTNGIFTFTTDHQNKRLRCIMLNNEFPFLELEYETIVVNGIADTMLTNFIIVPNPTSSDAIISFNLLDDAEITLEVYDLLGNDYYELIDFYYTGNHSIPISTEDFPTGTYICRMLINGRQVGMVSFVVVK